MSACRLTRSAPEKGATTASSLPSSPLAAARAAPLPYARASSNLGLTTTFMAALGDGSTHGRRTRSQQGRCRAQLPGARGGRADAVGAGRWHVQPARQRLAPLPLPCTPPPSASPVANARVRTPRKGGGRGRREIARARAEKNATRKGRRRRRTTHILVLSPSYILPPTYTRSVPPIGERHTGLEHFPN